MIGSGEIVRRAAATRTAIAAFNIPYLPMMDPVVRAIRDADAFAFVDVARLEWVKFQAGSPAAIKRQYDVVGDPRYTRLHLDHVPVIDEDGLQVDYGADIRQALALGFDSVMVDGSRLPLEENIAATRSVCEAAHQRGVPVEGELGAVMGHEAGPLPPYEELFATGDGFTDPQGAERFVRESGVDWLSIAFGNIHGAISAAARAKEKPRTRLAIDHLCRIRERVGVPIVLHGGSGIRTDYVIEAIKNGVAKINVASDLRRPYEALKDSDPEGAVAAVYDAAADTLQKLGLAGNRAKLDLD